MSFNGDFMEEQHKKKKNKKIYKLKKMQVTPRKSVVQVKFPGRGMSLAYYNDMYDLKCGDMVYVDGKLEGQLGRVIEVNYNFTKKDRKNLVKNKTFSVNRKIIIIYTECDFLFIIQSSRT